jgi:hypothetical protein
LKQAGWELPETAGRQEEDAVYEDIFNTDEARRVQAELAPWSVEHYPPDQVHAVLEWGFNKWMGEKIARFSHIARALDLIETIDSGGGVVLSGRFPMPAEEDLGHIVSLAGYVAYDGVVRDDIVRWILDDPYGDWLTHYGSDQGNNTVITAPQFKTIFDRGGGDMYAHFIRNAG